MLYSEFRQVLDSIFENNGIEVVADIPHERLVWLIEKFACEDFRQYFGLWPGEVCFDNSDQMYYRVGLLEFQTMDHNRSLDLALFGCFGKLIVEVNKWECVTFETDQPIYDFLKLVGVAKA